MKSYFDKKDFDTLSKALLKSYQSSFNPLAVDDSIWPYLVRKDKKLKNQVLLYNYLENRYRKKSSIKFKEIHKKQRVLIEKIKKERNERFVTLLEREYQERQTFFKIFSNFRGRKFSIDIMDESSLPYLTTSTDQIFLKELLTDQKACFTFLLIERRFG